MLTSSEALEALRSRVMELLESKDAGVQNAAIGASTSFAGHEAAVFKALNVLLSGNASKHDLVQALHRLPKDSWDKEALPGMAEQVITYAKSIDVKNRNKAPFLDTVQLGNEIANLLDGELGKQLRDQLADLQVPIIRVGTIKHQLKFDRTSFTVKAGRRIEIHFENTDSLPHNLLLAKPGSLEDVGAMADQMALQPDGMAKGFVPDSPKVIKSTKMLNGGQSEVLKIQVPHEKGEYLYICTFPGHWRTMHGKMIVK